MPNKYRNRITLVDGIKFDSVAESRRWQELKLLMRAGKISALTRQVPFVLAPSVKFHDSQRAKPALRMVIDFEYFEGGERVLEDVKGMAATKDWIIKRHLLKSVHNLDVRIVK